MEKDLNHLGRWPAMIETKEGLVELAEVVNVDFVRGKRTLPPSPYDLAEGMPQYQDSLDTATLATIIFVTGVAVAMIGVWLLDAPMWARFGFAFACGVFAKWITEKVGR